MQGRHEMQPGVSTVVVVGAGIAGLQTARAVLKRGLHVLVLEQRSDIGGVWTSEYPGFGVQVGYSFYELPEFPWPAHLRNLAPTPTHELVHAYLHEYAQHFGLLQHVRFGCSMLRLQHAPGGRWSVIYLDRGSGQLQILSTDYVVIATGMYSLANVPVYKGMHNFRGIQLHTKDFKDASLARGKRVVVVGAGRSALDCAGMVAASNIATSVTWLFRQPHWPIPQQLGNGLSMPGLIFSRLPSHLLPPYYNASAVQQASHWLTAPVKRAVWSVLQRNITRRFDLAGSLLPVLSLDADLLYSGQVIDAQWNKVLLEGMKLQEHKRMGTCLGPVPATAAAKASNSSQQQQGQSMHPQAKPGLCGCLGQLHMGRATPAAGDADSRCSSFKSGCGWWWVKPEKLEVVVDHANCAVAPAQSGQQQAAHVLPPSIENYGSIVQPLCGEIERFAEDHVYLRSGQEIAADLVLYATGYSKSYDYLDPGPKAKLGSQKDGLPLFRNILPPLLPGLAFIGAEVSTYNNVLTHGLQAEWLADVLAQKVKVPDRQAMQADVRQLTAWRRQVFPAHRNRAAGVQLYMEQYHAQLLQDRGLHVPRPPWVLQPLTARHYSYAFHTNNMPQSAPPAGMPLTNERGRMAKSTATTAELICTAAAQGSLSATPLVSPEDVAAELRAPSTGPHCLKPHALQSGVPSTVFQPGHPTTATGVEGAEEVAGVSPCANTAGFPFTGLQVSDDSFAAVPVAASAVVVADPLAGSGSIGTITTAQLQ